MFQGGVSNTVGYGFDAETNQADSGHFGFIGGGWDNNAEGYYTNIVGGYKNTAKGHYSATLSGQKVCC